MSQKSKKRRNKRQDTNAKSMLITSKVLKMEDVLSASMAAMSRFRDTQRSENTADVSDFKQNDSSFERRKTFTNSTRIVSATGMKKRTGSEEGHNKILSGAADPLANGAGIMNDLINRKRFAQERIAHLQSKRRVVLDKTKVIRESNIVRQRRE